MDAAAGRSYQTDSGIALTLIGFGTAVALGLRGRRARPGQAMEQDARRCSPSCSPASSASTWSRGTGTTGGCRRSCWRLPGSSPCLSRRACARCPPGPRWAAGATAGPRRLTEARCRRADRQARLASPRWSAPRAAASASWPAAGRRASARCRVRSRSATASCCRRTAAAGSASPAAAAARAAA